MKKLNKILIIFAVILSTTMQAQAESLFTLGAAQTYNPVPKSLYGGVQARTVGDLISIIMDERVKMTDTLTYGSSKKSNTVDNFTGLLNSLLGHDVFSNQINNFGGSNTVENGANSSRSMTFADTIAVQVVQQLPNGNLVVQGKKTVVNANERMDLIVTGVVDPRWINALGQVLSSRVANLQFASSGRGAISRSSNEGIINRFIKYLF